jgi:hypothetical protein
MYKGNRENLKRNNPTMNREYEQPGTNMGDTGELNNQRPAATQGETRWKNKKRNRTTATQWETQRKGIKKRKRKER